MSSSADVVRIKKPLFSCYCSCIPTAGHLWRVGNPFLWYSCLRNCGFHSAASDTSQRPHVMDCDHAAPYRQWRAKVVTQCYLFQANTTSCFFVITVYRCTYLKALCLFIYRIQLFHNATLLQLVLNYLNVCCHSQRLSSAVSIMYSRRWKHFTQDPL